MKFKVLKEEIMQIKKAFLSTDYIVYGAKYKIDDILIKIDSLNKKIVESIPNLITWAYLTAWNPLPQVLTLEQNRERNNDLKKMLEDNHIEFTEGIGVSEDGMWSEESFLIHNITEDSAYDVAVEFGQLAFVYGAKNQKAKLAFTK